MKKIRFVSVIFYMLLVAHLFAAADMPAGYQYIFPGPGAKFIHPSSTLIFRFRLISPVKLTNISEMLTIVGEKSGLHYGETTIASDKQTVIFKSKRDYKPGEAVKVKIEPRFSANHIKVSSKDIYETNFDDSYKKMSSTKIKSVLLLWSRTQFIFRISVSVP